MARQRKSTTKDELKASAEQLDAMREAFRCAELAEKEVETAAEQLKDKKKNLTHAEKDLRATVNAIVGTPELPFQKGEGDKA